MWTSQARTSPENSDCQSSSMISQPAEDLARALGEQPQDLELRAGQVDRLAADRDQVAGEVDPHRPGVDRLRLGHRARAVELAAAQLGADAADQLADRERLGHVVVGADLEPDDLVDLLRPWRSAG